MRGMLSLPVKVNRYFSAKQRNDSRAEKVVTFKTKLGLPFSVPDLVYKFQMIL